MNNVVDRTINIIFDNIVAYSLEVDLVNTQQWSDRGKTGQFIHNFINKLENKKRKLGGLT